MSIKNVAHRNQKGRANVVGVPFSGLQELKEEILRQVDVGDIAAQVGFKRVGRSWLCAFHADRHPSASIKNGRIRCFACNESWNAIDLVMKAHQVNFVDALKHLATAAGIPLPHSSPAERKAIAAELAAVEEEAAAFVNWRYDKLDRTTDERNRLMGLFYAALRYLIDRAQATLVYPEDERLDRFLDGDPIRRECAFAIIKHYDELIAAADGELDILRKARWDDLVDAFRADQGKE